MIKDLTLKPETIKLLEEKIGETFQEICIDDGFLKKKNPSNETETRHMGSFQTQKLLDCNAYRQILILTIIVILSTGTDKTDINNICIN